jgi:dihydrofolate reductase
LHEIGAAQRKIIAARDAGGTTFHFVKDGADRAIESATASANGKDNCVGGGVATVQPYLRAGLIDELNLAIAPALLGWERVACERATHVVLERHAK